jgi:phage terminase large subunit
VAERIITIPYKPRRWAQRFHASFRRWAALVLHRRVGKTTCIVNHHQRAALDDDWETQRLRTLMPALTDAEIKPLLRRRSYGHVMPTFRQAKLVAWDMVKHYARVVEGAVANESELLIKYPNGSRLQLFGADNPDSFRGAAFSGLSFDEYSQQPRNIFSEVLSKALADHLGYAIFAGTIKGKDHLYDSYQAAKADVAWFAIWQDIDVSLATEDGVTIKLLEQAMADDRALVAKGLMTQDEYDQEWYLSVDAAVKGAWFAKELAQARKDGRIARVPYDAALPVDTDWDLGMDDSMAIWFSQSLRSGEVRLIDYYEGSGEGFSHYVRTLREKPYVYGKHYPPHDIAVRELGTGKSRKEVAASLGLRFEDPMPALNVMDGIEQARLVLARCWFDETKCAAGLEALRQYRKAFNTRLQEFTGTPVHNWASHGADAFRGLAVRYQVPRLKDAHAPRPVVTGAGSWMA